MTPKPIPPAPYVYDARVCRVIDGDTIEVEIDLGFKITFRETVRIYGVDTPELNSPDPDVRSRASMAAMLVASAVKTSGDKVRIRSHKSGQDKYGRWLAEVMLQNGRDLSAELIAAGLGVAYQGGKK